MVDECQDHFSNAVSVITSFSLLVLALMAPLFHVLVYLEDQKSIQDFLTVAGPGKVFFQSMQSWSV